MRRVLIIAASLAAASAAAQTGGDAEARLGYPPCSRDLADHCVQLQDLSAADRLALLRQSEAADGVGGPYEPIEDSVEEHAAASPADGIYARPEQGWTNGLADLATSE